MQSNIFQVQKSFFLDEKHFLHLKNIFSVDKIQTKIIEI